MRIAPRLVVRSLGAVGLLLLLSFGPRDAAAQRLCPAAGSGGGHWPATATCCRDLSPALSCTSVSPALRGGRRNVVVAVLDDFGHCQSGFMGGRCVRQGTRCEGTVCSNARWMSCRNVLNCPFGECGQKQVRCEEASPGVCAPDRP